VQRVAIGGSVAPVPPESPAGVDRDIGVFEELLPKLWKVPGQFVAPNRDQGPEVFAGIARHGKRNIAVVMSMQREDRRDCRLLG
jgi:hypothetical protein